LTTKWANGGNENKERALRNREFVFSSLSNSRMVK